MALDLLRRVRIVTRNRVHTLEHDVTTIIVTLFKVLSQCLLHRFDSICGGLNILNRFPFIVVHKI